MYFIFDTETTTFPDSKLHARHPAQARICQLAAIKLNDKLEEVETLNTLIKPDGWQISSGASAVHGITNEMCEREGRLVKEVVEELEQLMEGVDKVVAHNIIFDCNMLAIEYKCLDKSSYRFPAFRMANNQTLIVNDMVICTMELTTPICKLPQKRKNAFGQLYKWPKLQEAYEFFFKEKFEKAHDALADVRATARIFKHLVDCGFYKVDRKEVTPIAQ